MSQLDLSFVYNEILSVSYCKRCYSFLCNITLPKNRWGMADHNIPFPREGAGPINYIPSIWSQFRGLQKAKKLPVCSTYKKNKLIKPVSPYHGITFDHWSCFGWWLLADVNIQRSDEDDNTYTVVYYDCSAE